jgi:L-alanine-DL-glutamate epimerase-like enolase superfamily enzyme
MKITHYETRILQTPADNPFALNVDFEGTREFVTLELGTDEGIEGIGVTFHGGTLFGALRQAVDTLAELAIGENPLHTEAIAGKLWDAARTSGPGGIFNLARSAIDMALWDIKGKAFNQPLCNLIGGYRDRAPVYASGGLMRTFSFDSLAKTAAHIVDLGFKQMKMQLGGEPTVAQELARARVVREAIDPEIDLMVDLNMLWDVNQAITVGRRLEPLHLFWLEDVVAYDDYQGLARVADALDTPIATGEYHYSLRAFRHMMELRSVDVVMIDIQRIGGITPWLKVAGMAEAFNLPVASHVMPEVQVHLIAGIPNGLTVEYMPWTVPLFEEIPAIEDGQIVVPSKPGLGLAFDRAAIRRYQIG